jgi:hypothetical protein
MRRANENGEMLTKVEKERKLLLQELARRIKTWDFFYKPVGNVVPVGFNK